MFSEFFLFLKAYFTLFTVTIRVIRLNNFHSISIFLTFINDILFLYVILSILFMFTCSLVLPLNFSVFLFITFPSWSSIWSALLIIINMVIKYCSIFIEICSYLIKTLSNIFIFAAIDFSITL